MIVSFLYPFNLRGVDAPHLWVYYHQLTKFMHNEIIFIGDKSYLYELEYFRSTNRWEVSNDFVTQKNFLEQKNFTFFCLEQVGLDNIYSQYETDLDFFREYLITKIPDLMDIIKDAISRILQNTNIDTVISWSNCPSLQYVCNELSIPVIYNEVGPLRPPVFLYSSFFDFSGVNGFTSSSSRFNQFILDFDSGKIELFQKDDLIKIFVKQEYLDLFNNVVYEPSYDYGLALQVENDSNVIAYANGFNNQKLIAMYSDLSNNVLIRKHPASKVDYSMFGELDSSENSILFIKKCKNIATVNSGTALESLFLGRDVYIHGDSPFNILNENMHKNKYDHELFKLLALNFLLISYLVPFEYLYDKAYIKFRLANKSEVDLFNFHKVIWMKVSQYELYQHSKYKLNSTIIFPENSHLQLFYYQNDEINVPDVRTLYFSDDAQTRFSFELDDISDLTHIRIDLTNFPVVANLEYVKLILADGTEQLLQHCYSNANLIEGNSYTYLHDDPINVYYLVPLNIALQKLVVEVAVDLQPIKSSEIFTLANQITTKQNEEIKQFEITHQQELADICNQLCSLQSELSHVQSQLATADEQLHNVYQSKSWKITKPLRKLCKLFKSYTYCS